MPWGAAPGSELLHPPPVAATRSAPPVPFRPPLLPTSKAPTDPFPRLTVPTPPVSAPPPQTPAPVTGPRQVPSPSPPTQIHPTCPDPTNPTPSSRPNPQPAIQHLAAHSAAAFSATPAAEPPCIDSISPPLRFLQALALSVSSYRQAGLSQPRLLQVCPTQRGDQNGAAGVGPGRPRQRLLAGASWGRGRQKVSRALALKQKRGGCGSLSERECGGKGFMVQPIASDERGFQYQTCGIKGIRGGCRAVGVGCRRPPCHSSFRYTRPCGAGRALQESSLLLALAAASIAAAVTALTTTAAAAGAGARPVQLSQPELYCQGLVGIGFKVLAVCAAPLDVRGCRQAGGGADG